MAPHFEAPPPPASDALPPPPPSNKLPLPPPSAALAAPLLEDVPPPPLEVAAKPGSPPVEAPAFIPHSKRDISKIPSWQDILKKKQEADAARAKPRFMKKAERDKYHRDLAEAEEKARKAQEARDRAERQAWLDGVDKKTNGNTNGNIPTGPRAMRQDDVAPAPPQKTSLDHLYDEFRPVRKGAKRMAPEEPMDAETAEVMRRRRIQYMGADQNVSTFSAQKKRRRTTEKKFNFGWNDDEDTSVDYNPLYQNRLEPSFFGRGQRGGYAYSDEGVKQYAEAMIKLDPVTGPARAKALIEQQRKYAEKSNRLHLDKHWSEKTLGDMKERDWRIFKEDFDISTKGGRLPNPMRNWQESNLPKKILDIVEKVGYEEPSAVQRAAIPIALQNRDLIGVAVTGSGKTAAFILPLLVYIDGLPRLSDLNRNDGPYALILAPTRELAQQIEVEARKFAAPLGFRCVSIVGGHSIEEQAYKLRDGAEIIIATPGRLVDCIDRRMLVFSQCCYVIMDEADRMIDMGFEDSVNKILNALPLSNEKPDDEDAENAEAMAKLLGNRDRYRQTMMYTATMPAAVERIARNYLRRPATVTIGNVGEAVDTVEQRVEFVSGEEKRKKRIAEILRSFEFKPPAIVFVNIKQNADAVAKDLKRMGFNAVTLHGGKTQDQREAALNSIRGGTTDVLVATDLAGRGIDVPDVSLVVNFNMPPGIEAYTHRIGRTGRAGKSGVAITFLGPEDDDLLYDLKQMISKSKISEMNEQLKKHEAAQSKNWKYEKGKPADEKN